MSAQSSTPSHKSAFHWTDLALVAFLIGFDVVARVIPHAPGVWPVAASALFAGRMLRVPALAVVVPVAAVVLSNWALPGDDWRIVLLVCLATAVPAFAGMLIRRWRSAVPVIAAMVSCSLIFFAVTNFAVWAFGTLYPFTWQGLADCYVAALPFLDKTVIGDLIWTAVLFGGAWAVNRAIHSRPALARRVH